jgi:hypothetical protein
MATSYKFKAYYKKSGVGTSPSSDPVCTVINLADDAKLADGQATTKSVNMPGLYSYIYSGNDGLDCVALFHTTDTDIDEQDLASYTPYQLTDIMNDVDDLHATDLPAVKTVLDDLHATDLPAVKTDTAAIKLKTDNLPSDPADESLLESAIAAVGGGVDAAGMRAALGMAAADLDAQLANILASGGSGSGAISWVYNLLDNSGNPVADALIWVTSDIAGLNVLASGRTDAFGNVTFYLDAGVVYVWGRKSGFDFINPDTEVVS